MNRRSFLGSSLLTGGYLLTTDVALAAVAQTGTAVAKKTAARPEVCVLHADEVAAESTGFTRYEHYHILTIPLSVLITPPKDGFKIRTSPLDPDSLDMVAIDAFLKETGLDESLKSHSHLVAFTQDELTRIARGDEKVQISVLSPKGNPAHDFYFTATPSDLIKIKRGREARG